MYYVLPDQRLQLRKNYDKIKITETKRWKEHTVTASSSKIKELNVYMKGDKPLIFFQKMSVLRSFQNLFFFNN